ncbi:hypothetical protein [Absidia glauca]|uniref:Uncharacterized protein n=1 Tax=Absidia glauca TaxID=4829 RepID=A0A163J5E2_ABSGL|nr:hypothetical protein [Absidia glauca]
MTTISRQQALCISFLYEYTDQNVVKAEMNLENMGGNLDVCYLTDPTIPVLVLKERINGSPFTFRRYVSTKKVDANPLGDLPLLNTLNQRIETTKHVVQFLNQAYVSAEVMDQDLYSLAFVSMKEIFTVVLQHSDCLENKTLNGFASFCGKNKLGFLDKANCRKRMKTSQPLGQRYRQLYVLKPEYYKTIIKGIVEYQDQYHQYVRDQKNQGFEIIGYARKPRGSESLGDRNRLLQQMVRNLRDRSLADHVFISPSSSANDKLDNRDNNERKPLKGTDGTTQNLIDYLNTTTTQIFLVCLGYAGLTTNVDDLQQFLSNHRNVKKILVDRLPYTSEVDILDSEEIITNNSVAERSQ